MEIDIQFQKIEKALTKLGICFCPVCNEPHNTRSEMTSDQEGFIYFHLADKSVYVCPQCATAWLKHRRSRLNVRKLGLSLSSWILDNRVYETTHPFHEYAVELCASNDIRFDLLLWRRSRAAANVLHGRTEEGLLATLGYKWDIQSRNLNRLVLEYIDHIRAGGRIEDGVWPPQILAAKVTR